MPIPCEGVLVGPGERFETWIRVLGCTTVPLLSPIATQALGPSGLPQAFYRMDTQRLTTDQRERLIDHLAQRFHLDPHAVSKLIDDPDHGVPVLAEDLVVATDLRAFL